MKVKGVGSEARRGWVRSMKVVRGVTGSVCLSVSGEKKKMGRKWGRVGRDAVEGGREKSEGKM